MLRVLACAALIAATMVPMEAAAAQAENWQLVADSGLCVDLSSITPRGKFVSWTQATVFTRADNQGRSEEYCPSPPRQPWSLEVDCTQNLSGTFEQYGFDPRSGQATEFSQTVDGSSGTQYLRDI